MSFCSYRPRLLAASVAAALAAVVATGTAGAATITVTTTDDGSVPGACTLRDAIAAANSNTATAACVAGDVGHVLPDGRDVRHVDLGDDQQRRASFHKSPNARRRRNVAPSRGRGSPRTT